jgi:hypothetical protein
MSLPNFSWQENINVDSTINIKIRFILVFKIIANGGNMKSWGLRSNSLSSYTALDASHNP